MVTLGKNGEEKVVQARGGRIPRRPGGKFASPVKIVVRGGKGKERRSERLNALGVDKGSSYCYVQ
jgi:hypothetical protein